MKFDMEDHFVEIRYGRPFWLNSIWKTILVRFDMEGHFGEIRYVRPF